MYSSILTFLLFLAVAFGKQITVRSRTDVSLTVSFTGQDDFTLLPHAGVNKSVSDSWSGRVSACQEVCDDVRTVAELNLGVTSDQYDVSLVNGFNLPIKVVPVDAHDCRAAVCDSRINNLCPDENKVTDSLGEIVACRYTPDLFQKLCPVAVIIEDDVTNVHQCSSEEYLILIG